MKRRFQEVDVFGEDDAERPKMRGTGFTDQELESRFGSVPGNGGGEELFDEATVRRMMRQQRADEEAAAKAAAAALVAPVDELRHHSGTAADSSNAPGAMPHSRPQSFGPGSSESAPAPAPAQDTASSIAFSPGDLVIVRRLKAAAHLNGERGRLGPLDYNTGRWEVTLLSSGDTKAIKPENLELDVRSGPGGGLREDMSAEELFVPPPSPDQAPGLRSPPPRGFSEPSVAPKSPPPTGTGRAGSGGVASLSSGSLVGAVSAASSASRSSDKDKPRKTTRRQGTVRWYNGRRKIGKVIADDRGEDLFIPAQGALNGSQVPPNPAGLFHGTRVSFIPQKIPPSEAGAGGTKSGQTVCMDVRPLPGQVGLTVGVNTDVGAKEKNDDRVAACDLHELGFCAGIFDGHRGSACAEYVAKQLPQAVLQSYRALAKRHGSIVKLSSTQEATVISNALSDAFEATDKAYLVTARKKELKDGCTGVLALVVHGFEVPVTQPTKSQPPEGGAASLWSKVAKKLGQEADEPTSTPTQEQRQVGTVPAAPGGVAKLFVAWAGDSRVVLIRGRQGLRCSEDHRPNRKDEMARIQKAGGFIGQDSHGVWRVGPKEESRFAKELQKGKKKEGMPRWFLATSRSFGDVDLKVPDPIITATPDTKVLDLVPEDWAVVLICDGISDVISDQQVANVVYKAMAIQGKDPVAASKALVQTALAAKSRDNLTAIVMRFGWAAPPREETEAVAVAAAADSDMFG